MPAKEGRVGKIVREFWLIILLVLAMALILVGIFCVNYLTQYKEPSA